MEPSLVKKEQRRRLGFERDHTHSASQSSMNSNMDYAKALAICGQKSEGIAVQQAIADRDRIQAHTSISPIPSIQFYVAIC